MSTDERDRALDLVRVIAAIQIDGDPLEPDQEGNYDADPYNEKTNRSGWFSLLEEAEEALEEILNTGQAKS